MSKQKQRLQDIFRHLRAGSVAFMLVVLLFTAGLATFVGVRIHDMRKETLLLQGEVNTQEATLQYDRYLLTRVDIVTLVSSKVESMMASGADSAEIEQYLTEQTNMIIDTLDPETTGLYGLIGGKYVDGAGWVPDADYVPTERPWYIQTTASTRDVTFVEPYLDAQTNTVMMTVSKLLRDGKSVLAMDVSLRPIQELVETVAAPDACDYAFLLDENGIGIVHSDRSQIGKNYLEEEDSTGGIVATRLLRDN